MSEQNSAGGEITSTDYKAVAIASVCHAANKAWCEANGDNTQHDWGAAEQWQRDSAIKGVLFRVENPHSGHDAQHNAWMADKVADGWVYGEVKDAEAKTHPCIVLCYCGRVEVTGPPP